MFVSQSDILYADKPGGIKQRMLGYSPKLMAVEMTFPKGAVVAPHSHPDHAQAIYIVRGKFELTCGEEKRVVTAGDICYADCGEVHGTLCLEEGSTLLDVHTPMRQDILDEGSPLQD